MYNIKIYINKKIIILFTIEFSFQIINLIEKKFKNLKISLLFSFYFLKLIFLNRFFSCLSLLIFFSDDKDCLWGLIFILDGILCLFISWLFTDIFELENVVFFCHQLIFLISFFFIHDIFFLSCLKGFYLFRDLKRLLILHVT